ncbi:sulfur carrier protein ThiS [Micromonospora zhanjiangensis]|uniref:Sulfur carrier protein ThiS n=1 Tax=Micromonospora zhanjiangensis TaxID=1522057 RepID=A0ABV8KG41_9ACTN
MTLTVNGDPREVPAGTTVAGLVGAVTDRTRGIAVAVNGAVVPRAEWPGSTLRDGDRVEVLTAAQGG